MDDAPRGEKETSFSEPLSRAMGRARIDVRPPAQPTEVTPPLPPPLPCAERGTTPTPMARPETPCDKDADMLATQVPVS